MGVTTKEAERVSCVTQATSEWRSNRTMHWAGIIAAIGLALSTLILIGSLLKATIIPGSFATQPRTYRAAVIAVLDRHAIPYRDVQVRNACPAYSDDCFTQNVLILTTTRSFAGSIVCRRYYDDCVLRLPALGLPSLPLMPLAQDAPWIRTLRHWLWQLGYALSTMP